MLDAQREARRKPRKQKQLCAYAVRWSAEGRKRALSARESEEMSLSFIPKSERSYSIPICFTP
eukprot:2306824-Pleurochrysis_carterae.AAC.10